MNNSGASCPAPAWRRAVRSLSRTLGCAFGLYCLSFAPAYKWAAVAKANAAQLEVLNSIYSPICLTAGTPAEKLVSAYAGLWGVDFVNPANDTTLEAGDSRTWYFSGDL